MTSDNRSTGFGSAISGLKLEKSKGAHERELAEAAARDLRRVPRSAPHLPSHRFDFHSVTSTSQSKNW